MKEPVMEVADGLGDKPDDGVWTKVFAALTTAWAERRKVRIRYTKEGGSTSERVVWPLFIEPTPVAHSLYLIAHDEKRRAPAGLSHGADLVGGRAGAAFLATARIVAAEDAGSRVGDLDVGPPGRGGAAGY